MKKLSLLRHNALAASTALAVKTRNWIRVRYGRPTTKHCPKCGSDAVVPLRSINMKICSDCKSEFAWTLDAGQKALMAPSRADRRPPGSA